MDWKNKAEQFDTDRITDISPAGGTAIRRNKVQRWSLSGKYYEKLT